MSDFLPTDWRLTGQEGFLSGAEVRFAQYAPPSTEWGHDHCVFCWGKFTSDPSDGCLKQGFVTIDGRYWICEQCFTDFRDQFGFVCKPIAQ
jgi:hypothetical protein